MGRQALAIACWASGSLSTGGPSALDSLIGCNRPLDLTGKRSVSLPNARVQLRSRGVGDMNAAGAERGSLSCNDSFSGRSSASGRRQGKMRIKGNVDDLEFSLQAYLDRPRRTPWVPRTRRCRSESRSVGRHRMSARRSLRLTRCRVAHAGLDRVAEAGDQDLGTRELRTKLLVVNARYPTPVRRYAIGRIIVLCQFECSSLTSIGVHAGLHTLCTALDCRTPVGRSLSSHHSCNHLYASEILSV